MKPPYGRPCVCPFPGDGHRITSLTDPQAGARSKEVAADAGLTSGENRHRVAEPFAVAAVDDTAFHGIDAVAVLMHHHVGIGGVGQPLPALKKLMDDPFQNALQVSLIFVSTGKPGSSAGPRMLRARPRAELARIKGGVLRQLILVAGAQMKIDRLSRWPCLGALQSSAGLI